MKTEERLKRDREIHGRQIRDREGKEGSKEGKKEESWRQRAWVLLGWMLRIRKNEEQDIFPLLLCVLLIVKIGARFDPPRLLVLLSLRYKEDLCCCVDSLAIGVMMAFFPLFLSSLIGLLILLINRPIYLLSVLAYQDGSNSVQLYSHMSI